MEYSKHKTVGIAQLLVFDNTELTESSDLLFSICTTDNQYVLQLILDSLKNTGLNVELRNTTVEI